MWLRELERTKHLSDHHHILTINAGEGVKKEDSSCPVDGNVNLQPVWESEGVLQKVKIDMPCNPTVLLPGIYPDKTIIQKEHTPLVYSSTIYNSQDMDPSQMSTDR